MLKEWKKSLVKSTQNSIKSNQTRIPDVVLTKCSDIFTASYTTLHKYVISRGKLSWNTWKINRDPELDKFFFFFDDEKRVSERENSSFEEEEEKNHKKNKAIHTKAETTQKTQHRSRQAVYLSENHPKIV